MYDASKHPDVMTGKKTSDVVMREFLDTFDVGGVHDGKVTREEFVNYYANVGASIDDDNYFELIVRNAWHISGVSQAAKGFGQRPQTAPPSLKGASTGGRGADSSMASLTAAMSKSSLESTAVATAGPKAGSSGTATMSATANAGMSAGWLLLLFKMFKKKIIVHIPE